MRALISLAFVLLLAGGAWYVFVQLPAAPTDGNGGPGKDPVRPGAEVATSDPSKPPAQEVSPAPPVPTSGEDKPDRRRLWERLRPAYERLLPDPDGVGPCPPVSVGGHPAPVIRRYRDPYNGFATWVHDDGAYTYLHFAESGRIDPTTGAPAPRHETVSTAVPGTPLPVAPEDLLRREAVQTGSPGGNQKR